MPTADFMESRIPACVVSGEIDTAVAATPASKRVVVRIVYFVVVVVVITCCYLFLVEVRGGGRVWEVC